MAFIVNVGFNSLAIDPVKYRDIALPFKNDAKGLIEEFHDLDCIRNGLRNIMSWQQGWRILNPSFGNILRKYIGEPISEYTTKAIKNEIESLLPKWEPRITLQNVKVDPIYDQNQYDVEIVYIVKSLDVQDAITFTILAGNG
jgi:phage baseplate assembly protein W